MRRLAAVVTPMLLAACIGSRSHEVLRYHVLEPPTATSTSSEASAPRDATLLVAPTTAASFYDAQEIAYSPAAGARAYYQFNNWTESPSQRINTLLLDRLERSGSFRTVADATSGVRGALLLSTHVAELYHDATAEPGVARVTIIAELMDSARRELVGRRTFSRSAPAASYDAAGAARGFGEAVGEALDDVVAWVDEAAPR